MPLRRHVTPLFYMLHGLPVCSWVKFKMLVLTFKALRDMEPCYLRDHLFLTVSVCPTKTGREGMLQVPSIKELHWAGPRRWAFSALASALWNLLIRNEEKLIVFNVLQISRDLVMPSGLGIPGRSCKSSLMAIILPAHVFSF